MDEGYGCSQERSFLSRSSKETLQLNTAVTFISFFPAGAQAGGRPGLRNVCPKQGLGDQLQGCIHCPACLTFRWGTHRDFLPLCQPRCSQTGTLSQLYLHREKQLSSAKLYLFVAQRGYPSSSIIYWPPAMGFARAPGSCSLKGLHTRNSTFISSVHHLKSNSERRAFKEKSAEARE